MNSTKRGMMISKYKKKYYCLRDKYNELIMAVSIKYPNESRHETALRFILERDNLGCSTSKSHTETASNFHDPSSNDAA